MNTEQSDLQDLLATFYRMLLESPNSVPVMLMVSTDNVQVLSPFTATAVAKILRHAAADIEAAPSAEVH